MNLRLHFTSSTVKLTAFNVALGWWSRAALAASPWVLGLFAGRRRRSGGGGGEGNGLFLFSQQLLLPPPPLAWPGITSIICR